MSTNARDPDDASSAGEPDTSPRARRRRELVPHLTRSVSDEAPVLDGMRT